MNMKLCFYTGPPVALMVRSKSNLRRIYGFYTGLNRNTGKPTNILLIHIDDIKEQPQNFKRVTLAEARDLYDEETIAQYQALGELAKTPAVKVEEKVDETPQEEKPPVEEKKITPKRAARKPKK